MFRELDESSTLDLHSTVLSHKKGTRECSDYSAVSHFSPIPRSRLSGVTPALRDLSPNTDLSTQRYHHSPSRHWRASSKLQQSTRMERRDKENEQQMLIAVAQRKSQELLEIAERTQAACGRRDARAMRKIRT